MSQESNPRSTSVLDVGHSTSLTSAPSSFLSIPPVSSLSSSSGPSSDRVTVRKKVEREGGRETKEEGDTDRLTL